MQLNRNVIYKISLVFGVLLCGGGGGRSLIFVADDMIIQEKIQIFFVICKLPKFSNH